MVRICRHHGITENVQDSPHPQTQSCVYCTSTFNRPDYLLHDRVLGGSTGIRLKRKIVLVLTSLEWTKRILFGIMLSTALFTFPAAAYTVTEENPRGSPCV